MKWPKSQQRLAVLLPAELPLDSKTGTTQGVSEGLANGTSRALGRFEIFTAFKKSSLNRKKKKEAI